MPRRRKGLTDEAIEQAKVALANFRAMQPTLTAYARLLTGNPKARVVADKASNGSTDGTIIYYRPPISLGKKITHQSFKCDRRNDLGLMECPACAQREEVLVTIYHEIAHIWFESFQGITDADKALAIREAITELGTKYADKIKARIAMHGSKVNFMVLAGVVSPFLPIILNCLEDARVNRMLFKALPGVEMMFDADTACIFDLGVEGAQEDGTWGKSQWRDAPLNHQATIGVFCMASGYNFESWLNPFVVKDLNDDQLKALVDQVIAAGTAREIFQLSFPILARLRELGYCRSSADPDDDWTPPFKEPDEDEQPPAPPAPSAGTDSDDDAPETEDDAESESDEPGDGEGSASEPGESGGDTDDPAEQAAGGDGSDSEGDTDEGEPEPGDGDEVDGEAADDADSGAGSAGREANDDDAEGAPEGEDEGASGAGADAGEAGDSSDDIQEDDLHPGDRGSDPDSDSDDSAGVRDGETAGSGLDGLPSADRGDQDDDEPGDPGDDSDDELADGEDDSVEPIETGDWHSAGMDDSDDDRPVRPNLPWGEAIEVIQVLADMGGHEVPHTHGEDDSEPGHVHHEPEDEDGDQVITAVMVSEEYFERPSKNVTGVQVHVEGVSDIFNEPYAGSWSSRRRIGATGNYTPPESILGPALLRARVVFAENARGRNEIGLRQGRVHSPSIGRKAPVGEGDFFRKRRLPGRTSYFVGIGVDVSGSTMGTKIDLIKQVAMAEAELLNRLGIPFFVYGHSGSGWSDMQLDMIEFKSADEPWNDTTRARLANIGPQACNLDGHTLQFYRKQLEKRREEIKILHYYTDGAMPLENFDEELVILREEILRYRQRQIVLAGVGVRTDSPKEHGLPTVIVESQADVIKVVEDLEQWLTRR
jgi:hypothetical protein